MAKQGEHKFRYLLPPGSNFQFVSKFRAAMLISCLLMAGSIAMLFVNKQLRGNYMNWTIDFKGGTEIVYSFRDKADASKYVTLSSGQVRAAVEAAGEEGADISDMSWSDDAGTKVSGMMVRTPRFSSLTPAQAASVVEQVSGLLSAQGVEKVAWAGGDRLMVRTKQPLVGLVGVNKQAIVDLAPAFAAVGLEAKPWSPAELEAFAVADQGTSEFNTAYAVYGIGHQLELAIEKANPTVDVTTVQSYGVGAKAGDKLRNDAVKSLFYAMFLILLYLIFRFDVRYAPGALFATLHDAVMVIGVFAVTWTEVSLTTVAAILTVIGYSVNDTVVIFDRIRENVIKLKDKRLERIVDISLNETLVRSIMTSLTVFAVTLLMNIFGDGLVRNFAFAMNVGVVVGSYSSLFLAPWFFLSISKRFYGGTSSARAAAAAAAQTA